jgi:hypothetical protein
LPPFLRQQGSPCLCGRSHFNVLIMDRDGLIRQVKLNCTISDAKFWGYYSVCGLLMRMRELYLNEQSLMPWDNAPADAVSRWVSGREAQWGDLEDEGLHEITAGGRLHDPFDADALNLLLKDSKLIYGSGYATFNKPTFFVAELVESRELLDYRVCFAGRELCRDLAAYAAMLQGRCIYVRYDVIKAVIFDRFQTMRSRRFGGVVEEMFRQHGIGKNDPLSQDLICRFGDMAVAVSELFVRHEVGEAYEDEGSEEWAEIIGSCGDRHSELYLRGIKDVIADTSVMGPLRAITEAGHRPLLYAYMAFLDGLRRAIFPMIGNAFQRFAETGEWPLIEEARAGGYEKAWKWRETVLRLWKDGGKDAVRKYLSETFSQGKPAGA